MTARLRVISQYEYKLEALLDLENLVITKSIEFISPIRHLSMTQTVGYITESIKFYNLIFNIDLKI